MATAPESSAVQLLGPVRARARGHPVDLPGPQPRLLLAALALLAPETVSADRLVAILWDHDPPATARKTLQKYVSQLRRALGVDSIATEGAGYRWAGPVAAVDVHVFADTVRRARAAAAGGDLAAAWDHFAEALAMWRGPPLGDLPDTPFAAVEAERLSQDRLAAMEERTEVGLELGRHVELVTELEDLVRRHPLRERLWAAYMLALYRSGRQADALRAYRRLRETLGEELGIDPSPELRSLEERILLHDPSLGHAPAGAGNLPAPHTSLVGRDAEVAEIVALIGTARLVTLTGAGGTGKTRLALEAATRIRSRFRQGAWFVDLTAVEGSDVVFPATAETLRITVDPRAEERKRVREHMWGSYLLIVLDNAEHVLGEAAAAARALVAAAPGVHVMTTSRAPLGLTGEVVLPVGPLPVPGLDVDAGAAGGYASVRLFVDRAAAASRRFSPDGDDLELVAAICRRVDGIPLAIELVARQLQFRTLRDLAAGIDERMAGVAAPTEPDTRHRTMDAAIGWSYDLLTPRLRRLLGVVSVFRGTFTAEAATRICARVGLDADVPQGIDELVAASMVVLIRGDDTRYRLLAPIRAFAETKTGELALPSDLSRAYTEWVWELLEENRPIVGPEERRELRLLSAEHHHFPAALDWAFEHDPALALRILIAAVEYAAMVVYRFRWAEALTRGIETASTVEPSLAAEALAACTLVLAENFGDHHLAYRRGNEAREAASKLGLGRVEAFAELAVAIAASNGGRLDDAARHGRAAIDLFEGLGMASWAARARHSVGMIELSRGEYEQVDDLVTAAAAIYAGLGSDWGRGKAMWVRAAAATGRGAFEEAERLAAEAYRLFDGFDDTGTLVHVQAVLADAARLAGDVVRAEPIYRECLERFQEVGDRRCTASTLRNLGLVTRELSRPREAVRYLTEALRRRHRLGDNAGIAECLEGLAFAFTDLDRLETAVVLLGAGDVRRRATGLDAPEPDRRVLDAAVGGLRRRVGKFDTLWRHGAGLDSDRLLTLVEEAASAPRAGSADPPA